MMRKKIIILFIFLFFTLVPNLIIFNKNNNIAKQLTTLRDQKIIVNFSAPAEVKEEVIDVKKQDPNYLSSSAYYGEKDQHSKIDKEEKGTFFELNHPVSGNKFLTAFAGDLNVSDLNIASDWTANKLSVDSMWIPLSCASKPSWLISNRYYLIDDGVSLGGQTSGTTHYYAIFDIQDKMFTRFGGNSINGVQANEKVIYTDTENDKIIFYIDRHDSQGSLSTHPDFKHSADIKDHYIIKRVIDPTNLSYDDYKIKYSVPDGMDAYYLSATNLSYTNKDLAQNTDNYNILLSESRDNYSGYLTKIQPDTKELAWTNISSYDDLSNIAHNLNYPNYFQESKDLQDKIIASVISQGEESKLFYSDGRRYVTIDQKFGDRVIFKDFTQAQVTFQLGSYNPANGTISLAFNINLKEANGPDGNYFLLTKIFK